MLSGSWALALTSPLIFALMSTIFYAPGWEGDRQINPQRPILAIPELVVLCSDVMPAVPNVGGDQCQLVCFGDPKLEWRLKVDSEVG